MTPKYLFSLWLDHQYVLSGQKIEASLKQTCGYDVICYFVAILLLFAGFFDQFSIFYIRISSSARYHLFEQVTETSFRHNDSLVALYPFFVCCFGLLDQFAIWLGVDEFKYWRILIFFSYRYIISGGILFRRL